MNRKNQEHGHMVDACVEGVDYTAESGTRWHQPFWHNLDDRNAFEIVRIRPQMTQMGLHTNDRDAKPEVGVAR